MRSVTDEPVVIARRFNGPPGSGHGGYSAGRAAALLGGRTAEVTLRRPPPLEAPLAGADVVAEARAAELVVDGPEPVGVDEAAAASGRFAWHDDHPFPGCF